MTRIEMGKNLKILLASKSIDIPNVIHVVKDFESGEDNMLALYHIDSLGTYKCLQVEFEEPVTHDIVASMTEALFINPIFTKH